MAFLAPQQHPGNVLHFPVAPHRRHPHGTTRPNSSSPPSESSVMPSPHDPPLGARPAAGRRPPRGGAPLCPPSPRPPALGPPPPPSAARLAVTPQCRSSSRTRSGTGRRPLQDELVHAVYIRRICALGPPPRARTRCVAGEGTSYPPPRLQPPRLEIHAPPPSRDWIGRPPRH
jgi:hypothetical protein